MAVNNVPLVIDPQAVSFYDIEQQMKEYINTRPDIKQWFSTFDAQTIMVMTNVMAGALTYMRYTSLASAKNTLLTQTSSINAAIAMAASQFAYSSYRGQNQKMTITRHSTSSTVISRFQQVGTVGENIIISLKDYALQPGEQTIECIVCPQDGVQTETITALSGGFSKLSFLSPSVSETFWFYVQGQEIFPLPSNPLPNTAYSSKHLSDLNKNCFVLVSNEYGAFDVQYLNQIPPNINSGTQLTLEYIPYVNTSGRITLDDGWKVSDLTTQILPETIDQIKANAPLYYETRHLIRSKGDYLSMARYTYPNIIDTSYDKDNILPASCVFTYITADGILYGPEQKQDMQNAMDVYSAFGVMPPIILDGNCTSPKLQVVIYLYKQDAVNYNEAVMNIISNLSSTFATGLDAEQLEHSIEDINNNVKIARVLTNNNFLALPERKSDTQYDVGDIVRVEYKNKSNDDIVSYYSALLVGGVSGGTMPSWFVYPGTEVDVDPNLGKIIEDGSCVWQCIRAVNPQLSTGNSAARTWSANSTFIIGEIINPVAPNLTQINYQYIMISQRSKSEIESIIPDKPYKTSSWNLSPDRQTYVELAEEWQDYPTKLGESPRFGNLILRLVSHAESHNDNEYVQDKIYKLGDFINIYADIKGDQTSPSPVLDDPDFRVWQVVGFIPWTSSEEWDLLNNDMTYSDLFGRVGDRYIWDGSIKWNLVLTVRKDEEQENTSVQTLSSTPIQVGWNTYVNYASNNIDIKTIVLDQQG